jgi:hypothetical protein
MAVVIIFGFFFMYFEDFNKEVRDSSLFYLESGFNVSAFL